MIIPPDFIVPDLEYFRTAVNDADESKLAEMRWSHTTKKRPAIVVLKGGPGSGHFGHKGRPGLEGGSLPKDNLSSESGDNIYFVPKNKDWTNIKDDAKRIVDSVRDKIHNKLFDEIKIVFVHPESQNFYDLLTQGEYSDVNKTIFMKPTASPDELVHEIGHYLWDDERFSEEISEFVANYYKKLKTK